MVRDPETNPRILMGQRGSKAAFMPNKFVFPGGAVDAEDYDVPLATPLSDQCCDRLLDDMRPETPDTAVHALAVAAIRELWEETGLILGGKGIGTYPSRGLDGLRSDRPRAVGASHAIRVPRHHPSGPSAPF